jgi:multidrug resistance efflux pump
MMKSLCYVGLSLGFLSGAGLGLVGRQNPPPGQPVVLPPSGWIAANGMSEGKREELALRSEVTGTLRAVQVRTGDPVRAGQPLAVLENETQKAHLELAEAELRHAQVELEQATVDLRRAREAGRGVSPQEKDRSQFAQRLAQHRLEEARARLHTAQAAHAKTELRAPWDGCVLRVFAEPGAQVGPTSAKPILLLADASRRQVRALVEELDALQVRVGQRAVVTADGLPGTEFAGRVREVWLRMDRDAPQSDAPGEYQDIYHRPVVIDLDDGRELPLNLRVSVRIEIRPADPRP